MSDNVILRADGWWYDAQTGERIGKARLENVEPDNELSEAKMNKTINRAEAVRRLKEVYRDAQDIQLGEDKCPSCKRSGVLYSAVVPPYIRTWTDRHGVVMEEVAWYCVSCRWGNAGSRPSLDGDGEVSEA